MKKFVSIKTLESKTCEGVKFTFRVMTEGIRTKLDEKLAGFFSELRDVQIELFNFDLPKDADGNIDKNAKLPMVDVIKINQLNDRIERLQRSNIRPAYFDVCFKSVDGLEIDGNPNPSGEMLREFGPPELYKEIVDEIINDSRLSTAERENLESPTTSAAVVDGRSENSIADIAENGNSTTIATVQSISPAK